MSFTRGYKFKKDYYKDFRYDSFKLLQTQLFLRAQGSVKSSNEG